MEPLPDLASVQRLTAEYVRDHNELMPHYAHAGATPVEIFSGTWSDEDRQSLERATRSAHLERASDNRAAACGYCAPTPLATTA